MNRDFKAGVLVITAAVAFIYMTSRIKPPEAKRGEGAAYVTYLPDTTGLIEGSKVKVAGIDVGHVTGKELRDNRAEVRVEIFGSLKIYQDASLRLRSVGYLGDKFLELSPGSEGKPAKSEGAAIVAREAGGTIEELTDESSSLMRDLSKLTKTLNDALGEAAPHGKTRLQSILRNLEGVAENLGVITAQVRRGEGTVGKLVSDPETADQVQTALAGVSRMTEQAGELRVGVRGQSGILAEFPASRNEFALEIEPGLKNLLLLGVTYRPEGATAEDRAENRTAVGIDAQAGRRFGSFRFRLGLFEGTAGAAADVFLLRDELRLSAEGYRIHAGRNMQINLMGSFFLGSPIYLWSGVDYLSSSENRSFLIGAGLHFNLLGETSLLR